MCELIRESNEEFCKYSAILRRCIFVMMTSFRVLLISGLWLACLSPTVLKGQVGLDIPNQVWLDANVTYRSDVDLFSGELSFRDDFNSQFRQVLTRFRYGRFYDSNTRFDVGLASLHSLPNNSNGYVVELRPYLGWQQTLWVEGDFFIRVYTRSEFMLFPQPNEGVYNVRFRIRPQLGYSLDPGLHEGRFLMLAGDIELLQTQQLSTFNAQLTAFRFRGRARYPISDEVQLELSYFYEMSPSLKDAIRNVYRFAIYYSL